MYDSPSPSAYAHTDVSHVRQIPGQKSEPFGYGLSHLGPLAGNGGIAIRYIHAGTYLGVYNGDILTRAQRALSNSLYPMKTGHPDRVLDASVPDSCNARSINETLDDEMENVESILTSHGRKYMVLLSSFGIDLCLVTE